MPVSALRQAAVIAFLLLVPAFPATAADSSILVDFESFPGPDGVLGTADDIPAPPCDHGFCFGLTHEYDSLGMLVSSGTLEQGSFFPGTPATNHFISSAPLVATLTRPVSGISITSYSVWTVTLFAYDENHNVLASDTLTNPDPGSFLLLGTLHVSANQPIRSFAVLPAGCTQGGTCGPIANLDNLVLSAAPDIPTLSGWGLLLLAAFLGAGGALLIHRKT